MAKNKKEKLTKEEKNKIHIETIFECACFFALFDMFLSFGEDTKITIILVLLTGAFFVAMSLIRTDNVYGGFLGMIAGIIACVVNFGHSAFWGIFAMLASTLFLAEKEKELKKSKE